MYDEGEFGPEAFPEGKAISASDIAPGMMKFAEPLIPVLGEELVKKIFSSSWATRDEGLKDCEAFVREQISASNS